MLKHFINLQWKSFVRSASFKTELWIRILTFIFILYFLVMFLSLGVGLFFMIRKMDVGDPLIVVNRFLIYYVAADLFFRYMLQKMPVTNIKPLLYLPFTKNQVVHFSLGKTLFSFFNVVHAFFFVPFSVVLVGEGYPLPSVIGWHLALFALIYTNNFLNVLVNNKDALFFGIATVFVLLGLSQYLGWFDVTVYTAPVFNAFYNIPYTALGPWLLLALVYFAAFTYFRKHMYLDAGLASKTRVAKTENLEWLDRFGNLGTFLKNDIKLLKRNKRSRTTLLMSVAFLFYGTLFFSNAVEAYQGPFWGIFAGIFVTGGFLFTFGQYVPSWDSSYYPLMMSQNIRYREYLSSKWYLIMIATVISMVLGSAYLYFGWQAYLSVLVGGIYNLGVNSYLVLWGGAYVKSPIDLTSSKRAFGDKQAFNGKTMLLTIPKLALPVFIYFVGDVLYGPALGYALIAFVALLGFALRDKVFGMIENIYKKEKYKTLAAYKQKA